MSKHEPKLGIVQVKLETLRDILKLPKHTKLLRVRQDWEQERRGEFDLLVESKELNKVPEHSPIPWVQIHCHYGVKVKGLKRSEVKP